MTKEVGITVKKSVDFSDWYTQCVIKSGIADYSPGKGFIILRPYGYAIWENIKEILDDQFKNTGHKNGFLPVLIPESLLTVEKNHFEGFMPEVYWVTKSGNNDLGEKLAVRPTSETLAYSMFSKWISSYRDLPLKLNFWNSALRAEIKSTKPLIRNSEFLWQEGHTAHSNEKEANDEVRMILDLYKMLIEEYLAIPTVSGLKTDKEKFVGANYTTCLESLMPDGKALQMATSHNLAQNFSKPFEIKFLDKDSAEHLVWQTSWGISWRVIGALIMVHGDDKGLILPPKISPTQIIIVPIYKDESKEIVKQKAYELENKLKDSNIRAYTDDRDEFTSGWKFNEWEMKGVPLRVNIGIRDIREEQVELIRRDTRERFYVKEKDLVNETLSILENIQSNMYHLAKNYLLTNTRNATRLDELLSMLDSSGGFVACSWCGKRECEDLVKEKTTADIRIIPFNTKKNISSCIACGKEGTTEVYFGSAY
ncbi:MAG: proline--tRNA ligase [Nitrososphaeraceae archaeon]|nr:proline--tRNA ligase [Nitrososphaeraceae archaeon]MDW0171734.1 proline--tRNA ligase [Nitrososphaeraceae archaeon]MDW0172999.1 proline--tRNA ligase [Nitrososphaeraceae archaeon]MDW0180852.1 proline--tRNA ligase [Nitrososphaeraceae archaeon]MDW0181905.1 proline--tRNA ligase [Nitrososphaeraceae archaeon]